MTTQGRFRKQFSTTLMDLSEMLNFPTESVQGQPRKAIEAQVVGRTSEADKL